MVFIDEYKTGVLIFSGKKANELLRKGYTIIQVRPDKRNKIKTVFVFKYEKEIEKELIDLTGIDEFFA